MKLKHWAVASILNATVPLFMIVIAHFWLEDDKMTLQKMLGLLVGFAGMIILLSQDLTVGAHNSVILAAIFYAGSALFARPRCLLPNSKVTTTIYRSSPSHEQKCKA